MIYQGFKYWVSITQTPELITKYTTNNKESVYEGLKKLLHVMF